MTNAVRLRVLVSGPKCWYVTELEIRAAKPGASIVKLSDGVEMPTTSIANWRVWTPTPSAAPMPARSFAKSACA